MLDDVKRGLTGRQPNPHFGFMWLRLLILF